MRIISKYLRKDWPQEPPRSSNLPTGYEYTKLDSAINQILTAIELFLRGRYDCAITLAGAAEGMLPKTRYSSHRMFMRMSISDDLVNDDYAKLDKAGRNSFWNKQRDWLKHNGEKHSHKQLITRIDAGGMIFRAISHLPDIDLSPENEKLVRDYFEIWVYDTKWKKPEADVAMT